MKIIELAEYCKSIDIDCGKCMYEEECEKMTKRIEDMSPFGIVDVVDNNEEL